MKNKKGFFFTIVVLFLIILLMLISFEYRKSETKEALRTRVLATNNFVNSIETDASRAVYISGYRTMLAIMDYFATQTNPRVTDPSAAFADALFNKTLKNSLNYDGSDDILSNTTLKDWQDRVKIIANYTGFSITFSDIEQGQLKVLQNDPWHIIISIPVKYNISDSLSNVRWQRDTMINASIPITDNFEDPLYIIKFGSRCTNKIIKNTFEPSTLVTWDGSCHAENLSIFLNTNGSGSMYIASQTAPSYLNRMKGIDTPDDNGIESLINMNDLQNCYGNIDNESTIVDFEYVGGADLRRVDGTGIPTWIILGEDEAKNIYGIDGNCLI
jgi:hypothetical protein